MLDMIMPKKSGKEAYDRIIKMRPNMKNPIFQRLHCGQNSMDKDSMVKEGYDFIMKPASPKDLLKKK